jgi:hypothetical protein
MKISKVRRGRIKETKGKRDGVRRYRRAKPGPACALDEDARGDARGLDVALALGLAAIGLSRMPAGENARRLGLEVTEVRRKDALKF